MRRRLSLLLLTVYPALLPSSALAHAVLIGSTPATDGHVPAGHIPFMLRYNSRIDAGRSKVTVTAPDGTVQRLAMDAEGPDRLIGATDMTAGAYVLHWQVLAVDGHITRGVVPFTVDAPKS